MCVQTGLIVWINGPFTAGKYNDITISRLKMIYDLLDWEMIEADQGYVGQPNKICMKYELGVSENQFKAKGLSIQGFDFEVNFRIEPPDFPLKFHPKR